MFSFFFGFSKCSVTEKDEITWGEDLTFISTHSPPHTFTSLKVRKDLLNLGATLKDRKLSVFHYPMWLEQMSSLELCTPSSKAWAEGSASAGPCMTNFLSASDFIII